MVESAAIEQLLNDSDERESIDAAVLEQAVKDKAGEEDEEWDEKVMEAAVEQMLQYEPLKVPYAAHTVRR